MKTWSDVAEVQPLVSKIITNSIKKDRVSHAYLLQGERGTGKEAIARLLAKGLFCEHKQGVEPCHTCTACKRIESRNHPDVHWVEPDGQSIKMDQIRNLQKEFTYSGVESNQKVYIIIGADTLTVNAANRILKFLEEPSKKTTAIMLTENSQSIIPTIRSRCQVIDLQPLNPTNFQQQLIDAEVQDRSAKLISALTNNLEEAMALNEDEWFATARKLMVQLVEAFTDAPDDAYLFIHNHWVTNFKERKEQEQGLDLLLLAFKDILYFHIGNEDRLVVFTPGEERLERLGMYFSQEKLVSILHHLLQAKQKLKQNVHPTLVMEQLTLQIQR
ncbi:DNA polymerase III subunit delta' [Ornithinibacillus salinisoli]|uniref:DNA polymerase III subunit delta n=1 Tax=Ornithinibacillus salinisoli TaxID=1848459 RepID=A0ABW4W1A9_9BACI